MTEKIILNTRIINKHDTEANWLENTDFIPEQGELIIYDVDENYSYERFKIGDGQNFVSELSFGHVQSDWNQTDPSKHDYINNKPTAMPNPEQLIINGVVYDGSSKVELQLDDVEIVESVGDMEDPKKYYALKNDEGNGDIWWYVYRKGHTNWLPIAYESYDPAPTDDNIPPPLPLKNGEPSDATALRTGYRMNWRVNGGTGKEEEPPAESGFCYLTGYIPVHAGSVVTCENIKMNNSTYGCIAAFYDANGEILASKHVGYQGSYIVDNEYNGITITVPPSYTTAKYIRIQGYYEYGKTPELNTATIVVDEPITDYETGWQWEDSGIDTSLGNDTALLELTKRVNTLEEKVDSGSSEDTPGDTDDPNSGSTVVDYGLPDYWSSYLDSKITTINNLLKNGGRNAFAYIVMSDLHIAEQRALYTGKIARRIMDECKIKNALDLGDHTSRGYIDDRATSDAQFDACRALVEPIKENILPTQGNHDGTMSMSNGTVAYYTPAEALDQVYGGMRTDMPIVWDEHGSGYYVDDRAHRVRYIILNTCARGGFTGDLTSNGGYTYFRYTQGQYDLVKEALTSMPNDRWRVVVASHIPPVGTADRFGDGLSVSNLKNRFPDAPEMRKLLAAYVNRESVSINYTDTAVSYGTAKLDADFSNAKGRLIVYHSGHLHVDLLWNIGDICDTTVNDALAFPLLGHRCDSFNENQGSTSPIEAALEAERVVGTTTEHSFDVVVVNPDADIINIVKIGAGQDRVVSLSTSGEIQTIYTITNNLTNVSSSNSTATILEGASYSATLSANSGYTIDTVTVTMGETDITSTAYANGQVSIAAVTGNLVITASATKDAEQGGDDTTGYTNYADPTSEYWMSGYRFGSSGTESELSGYPECIITNYIPFVRDSNGDYIVRIKGLNITSSVGGKTTRTVLYDDIGVVNGLITTITSGDASNPTEYDDGWITVNGDVTTITWGNDSHAPKYIRISGTLTGTAEDVIITVNEDIL